MANIEIRDYNLPFYAGWQLHFILRKKIVLYQSHTTLGRMDFRVHGTKDDHLYIQEFIRSFLTEYIVFKIAQSETPDFIKEIEVWGLDYTPPILTKNKHKIIVSGNRNSLNLFETYYKNSKLFPEYVPAIEESPKL